MRITTKLHLLLFAHGFLLFVTAHGAIAQESHRSINPAEKLGAEQGVQEVKNDSVPPDPDIDTRRRFAANETCLLADVIAQVGVHVQEFVDNLNRLTATEIVRHSTFSHSGTLHQPEIQKSEYVISAKQGPGEDVRIEEYRGRNLDRSPEPSSDHVLVRGAFSAALIFHPHYAKDFQMSCSGLASWHGKPAWQIQFIQQSNYMNRLIVNGKAYSLRLRGRAWVLSDSYQLARVETDLVNTIPAIRLSIQHQIIEYSQQAFPGSTLVIWVPSTAELYMDFRGHRFYRQYSYTDFQLFSVKIRQQFGRTR